MVEKRFTGVLILDWKTGDMRLIKKAPSKPEASEISVKVDIVLEIPEYKPIEAQLEGRIEVPEHKVKKKVIDRLLGKKGICPKCNEKIKQLSYNSYVAVTQDFSVDETGFGEYSVMDDYGEHINEEYKCPECYETLFTDEDKALKFLK